MTDGTLPIRPISGNLQEFQVAVSELTDVAAKVVIYEAFCEGMLPNILPVTALQVLRS
jgi:hypothetical protein